VGVDSQAGWVTARRQGRGTLGRRRCQRLLLSRTARCRGGWRPPWMAVTRLLLVGFPRVQTQEDFAHKVLALFYGERHERPCTRVTHQPFDRMALQIAPPMTWRALLATVKAASLAKHLAAVMMKGASSGWLSPYQAAQSIINRAASTAMAISAICKRML
jgi:hypothetical protein